MPSPPPHKHATVLLLAFVAWGCTPTPSPFQQSAFHRHAHRKVGGLRTLATKNLRLLARNSADHHRTSGLATPRKRPGHPPFGGGRLGPPASLAEKNREYITTYRRKRKQTSRVICLPTTSPFSGRTAHLSPAWRTRIVRPACPTCRRLATKSSWVGYEASVGGREGLPLFCQQRMQHRRQTKATEGPGQRAQPIRQHQPADKRRIVAVHQLIMDRHLNDRRRKPHDR